MFSVKYWRHSHETIKTFPFHPLVTYLTTLCTKLILYIMVTECCSLLNTGYCDCCLLLSCSVSKVKGAQKANVRIESDENLQKCIQDKSWSSKKTVCNVSKCRNCRKTAVCMIWNYAHMSVTNAQVH